MIQKEVLDTTATVQRERVNIVFLKSKFVGVLALDKSKQWAYSPT